MVPFQQAKIGKIHPSSYQIDTCGFEMGQQKLASTCSK